MKTNKEIVVNNTPNLSGFYNKKVIDIEISDSCDLSCLFCYTSRGSQSRKDMEKLGLNPEIMSISDIETVIAKAKELNFDTVISGGHGEPTIDKERFWRFIEIIKKYGMTPGVVTHGLWITKEDAQKLLENDVTVITKLWSLKENINRALLNDKSESHGYTTFHNAQIPVGLANLISAYLTDEVIEKKGHKIAINTVINRMNQGEVISILEWYRKLNILPYFEFLFTSGEASNTGSLWLDGQCGKTIWEAPFTEREMRRQIFTSIVSKDNKMGYNYPITNNPTGKVGQNVFDNSSTITINPYGYSVRCPAMAKIISNENGKPLHAINNLEEIVQSGFGKCADPCNIGEFSCLADKVNRQDRYMEI